MYKIKAYENLDGSVPFDEWLNELDLSVRARIQVNIRKLELGNFSRVEKVTSNVNELKLDFGPGYRIYYAQVGKTILLLLLGGTKKRQDKDIEKAQMFYDDYQIRETKHGRKKL